MGLEEMPALPRARWLQGCAKSLSITTGAERFLPLTRVVIGEDLKTLEQFSMSLRTLCDQD